MTAKQYLRQAYRLNELINSDLAELEQLKALMNQFVVKYRKDISSKSL